MNSGLVWTLSLLTSIVSLTLNWEVSWTIVHSVKVINVSVKILYVVHIESLPLLRFTKRLTVFCFVRSYYINCNATTTE